MRLDIACLHKITKLWCRILHANNSALCALGEREHKDSRKNYSLHTNRSKRFKHYETKIYTLIATKKKKKTPRNRQKRNWRARARQKTQDNGNSNNNNTGKNKRDRTENAVDENGIYSAYSFSTRISTHHGYMLNKQTQNDISGIKTTNKVARLLLSDENFIFFSFSLFEPLCFERWTLAVCVCVQVCRVQWLFSCLNGIRISVLNWPDSMNAR